MNIVQYLFTTLINIFLTLFNFICMILLDCSIFNISQYPFYNFLITYMQAIKKLYEGFWEINNNIDMCILFLVLLNLTFSWNLVKLFASTCTASNPNFAHIHKISDNTIFHIFYNLVSSINKIKFYNYRISLILF